MDWKKETQEEMFSVLPSLRPNSKLNAWDALISRSNLSKQQVHGRHSLIKRNQKTDTHSSIGIGKLI
jgi:hypothetical protein